MQVYKLLLILPLFSYGQLVQNMSIGCGYNYEYPTEALGSCGHVNVNHQAVAMGQIITYWNHPNRGFNNVSYISNYGFLSTDFSFENTSLMLLSCDISVHSNYSVYLQAWQCGVITLDTINKSLHDHYGYKWGNVITSDISSIVEAEIDQNRPVIMELYPTNNQCSRFVIVDGYDNGYFHFNFGIISGPFVIGGWYPMNDINVMGTNWTLSQKALVGIEPDSINVNGYILNTNEEVISGYVNGQYFAGEYQFKARREWDTIQVEVDIPWGNVNATDALLVLKHFVGLTELIGIQKLCADVNGDGMINSIDALYICKRFAGVINCFPTSDWVQEQVIVNSDTTVNIHVRERGNIN